MKLYAIVISLLICCSAFGANIKGTTTGLISGGVASSGTTTVSYTTSDSTMLNIYNGAVKGQSLKVPSAVTELTAFRFRTGSSGVGGSGTATIRCGTAADLSSNYVENTVAVAAVDTTYGVTFSSGLSVTPGNTVYCGVRNDSTTYANRFSWLYQNVGGYADGQYFSATSTWNLGTGGNSDYWFEVDFQ